MLKLCIVALSAFLVYGCDQKAETDQDTRIDPTNAAGNLEKSAEAYRVKAQRIVGQASEIMVDAELSASVLSDHIRLLEDHIELAKEIDAPKSALYEAELTSTLGSLYARKAAFYQNDARQAGALAAKGFRFLDKAVSKYPDNLTARINRGVVSVKAPEFLNKTAVAKEDLEFVKNSEQYAYLTAEVKQLVESSLVIIASRLSNDA